MMAATFLTTSALVGLALAAVVIAALSLLRARDQRAARADLLTATDSERRRIERDLHDGAQQRLIALRMQIALTAESIDSDPAEAAARLRRLGDDLDAAIDSMRSFARSVYPAVLDDHGLPEALRAAALDSAIPVKVLPGGIGRYPRAVESAVYFCCLEALQNVAKHSGATTAAISLAGNDPLRFEVRDDGAGFDPAACATGAGLTNMRERLAAIGGELTVNSAPGRGTVIAGRARGQAVTPRAAWPSRA